MDISSVTKSVSEKINSELRERLSEIIDDYSIPVFPTTQEKDEECLLTIYVSPESTKKNKKNKTVLPKLKIEFNTYSEFDLDKLREESIYISDISYIWSILKAEYAEPARKQISSWSRQLFTALRKMYKESYDLELLMLPFEIYIDENDIMYISRLPKFEDLWFYDKTTTDRRLNTQIFLEDQAKSIIDVANRSDFFNKSK